MSRAGHSTAMARLLRVALTMHRLIVSVCAGLAIVAGCGPYRASTDPDAMSEEAHRQRADDLHARAGRHSERYDPGQIRVSDTTHGGYEGIAGGDAPGSTHPAPPGQVMDPTAGHVREARRLRELAREHEAAADALAAFEAVECAAIPPTERAGCPLIGVVEASRPIEGGVTLAVVEGENLTGILGHARCHVAFGRRRGREGMTSCPLYVEGAEIERIDGRLLLRTTQPSAVEELRRRVALHVGDE